MKELTDLAKKGQCGSQTRLITRLCHSGLAHLEVFLVTKTVGEADKPEMNWVAACAKDSPVGKGIQEDGKRNISRSWHIIH